MKFSVDEIQVFAQKLAEFFLVFDSYFLCDPDAEELLKLTRDSLQEKVSFNESALAVIVALGGQYDSRVDRAKAAEAEALLQLLAARKVLRTATIEEDRRAARNSVLLSGLFAV